MRVEKELTKLNDKLEAEKLAGVFSMQVYAFNCSAHEGQPYAYHIDSVSGGGRMDIPNALQATIEALETALAQLKAQVQ